MISIRQANLNDLLNIQHSNLLCLPENYKQKYFMFHLMTWPNMTFVAEDVSKEKVVGYVLVKIDEEAHHNPPHGHITSLAVQRNHRRRGIAQRLMNQACQVMIQTFNARFVSLHVRESNRAAFSLYSKVLNFTIIEREIGYYADGEDGLLMQKDLLEFSRKTGIAPAEPISFYFMGKSDIRKQNNHPKAIHDDSENGASRTKSPSKEMKNNAKALSLKIGYNGY